MLHSVVTVIVLVVKTFHFSVYRPTLFTRSENGKKLMFTHYSLTPNTRPTLLYSTLPELLIPISHRAPLFSPSVASLSPLHTCQHNFIKITARRNSDCKGKTDTKQIHDCYHKLLMKCGTTLILHFSKLVAVRVN